MKAVIYARVSSDRQEKEGFSIPAQLDLLRDYAKKQGYTVAIEYTEAETAKKAGREAFTEMMQALKLDGAPKILLVEKTDRLYRNFKDFVLLEDLITECGLQIHLVKEGETISQTSNSHLKFIHGIKVLMAKNYIDNLREEIGKGMQERAKQGGWLGPAPHGYRWQNKHLVIHEEHAEYVKTAFRLYGTGAHSLESLRKEMARLGFQFSPSVKMPTKSGLDKLLKNRVYLGEVQYQGQHYPGRHPAIITLGEYRAVQAAFQKDSKPMSYQTRQFLFRGLGACSECGATLSGEVKKGKYTYYRCASACNGQCQNKKYINEKRLTELVEGVFKSISFPADFRASVLQALDELDTAKDREDGDQRQRWVKGIDSARDKMKQAYKDRLNGLIDAELYSEVATECQSKIDALKVQLDQQIEAEVNYTETATALLELPTILSTGWIRGNEEEKATILNLVYSNFFWDGQNIGYELNEPFSTLLKMDKNKNWWCLVDDFRTVVRLHHPSIERLYRTLAA